jgi:tetratricopeptide (TPR) repeat protein
MRDVANDVDDVRRECASGALSSLPVDSSGPSTRVTAARAASDQSVLITPRRLALVAVGLVAIVLAVYALFLRSSRAVGTPSPQSVNSSAYDYYLRGKVNADSQNRENNESAIKLLEQAIAADPNFAPAYADLARAYYVKAFYFASDAEKKKLNEDAEVAVQKALALNQDLAEAHFARGLLLWTHGKRFPHEQTIQFYKRALSLNPNLDEAHHQLGVVYFHIGLLDKAWEEIEKALATNPANTLARFRFGVINIYRAKYEEALEVFKTIPREANPSLVDRNMATAVFQLGRTQEASEVVEEYLRIYPTDEGGNVTSVKAMLLAKAGKEREAEETIQRAVEIGKGFGHFHHTAYNIASAYALINKPEQAVKWLQTAADDGFPCYPLFENDANLNSLRNDQRFIAFMSKSKQQWERYNATL